MRACIGLFSFGSSDVSIYKMPESGPIELIARVVIIKNKKILLCWGENPSVFYFPGGHVEFGEKAETALKREIKEETCLPSNVGPIIGVVQNTFTQKGITHHEVNFVFTANIPTTKVVSAESHVNFRWVQVGDLSKTKVLPTELKQCVMKWQKDKKIFWKSQGFKN